jgi:hypothetical protein
LEAGIGLEFAPQRIGRRVSGHEITEPITTTTACAYIGDYYHGVYYNRNDAGEILTSPDGTNWQVQFTSPAGLISGLAYSGGTVLAIATYGAMFKSSDGTNWTSTGFNLPLVDGASFDINENPSTRQPTNYTFTSVSNYPAQFFRIVSL